MNVKILLFIGILFCSVFSAYPPICNDYFEDSGVFYHYSFGGNDYYVMNQSKTSSNCMNELFIYFYYYQQSTSDFLIFVERYGTGSASTTGGFGATEKITWDSNYIFINNKTIQFNGQTGLTPSYKIILNGTTLERNSQNSISYFSKPSNYFIYYHTTSINASSNNATWSLSFPIVSQNDWRTNNTDFLFNRSNMPIYNTIPQYFYVRNSAKNKTYSDNGFQIYRTGEKYTIYGFQSLNNIDTNLFESSYNYSSTSQLLIFQKNTTSGSFNYVHSDLANSYKAYLLYGSTLITPYVSAYYTSFNGMNPYVLPMRFNSTDLSTTLYGNVATIVQDSNGICYFAPPYTPSNYSLTYSISVYQTSCPTSESGDNSTLITFPLLPNHINCGTNGNNYISNITYDTDVLFETYITYKNASVEYNSSLASSLFSNITLTNETSIIDIQVNNRTRCYWTEETSVFGFNFDFDELTTKLVGIPLLIVAVGLSMINPFVFLFVFIVNDLFSLLAVEYIFFLAIATGILSFVANWNGERNFKVLMILFLLASAYVVQVSTFAPTIAGTELIELTNLTDSIQTLFSGIQNGENLAGIIISVLPIFLLNFIILILKLPAILISIIFASIGAINPLAITPLRYFEGALIVGAYVFILLKAYEMGRNMFKSV